MRRWVPRCLTIILLSLPATTVRAAATLRLTVQGLDGKPMIETPCKLELNVSAGPGTG